MSRNSLRTKYPTADRAANLAMYKRLKSGDTSARNEMIERNMGLVFKNVNAFIFRYPHAAYLRDDLVSEGMVGLTQGVDDLITAEPPKNKTVAPAAYLKKAIWNNLGFAVEQDDTIQMSRRTRGRMKEKELLSGQQMDRVRYDDEVFNSLDEVAYDPRSFQDLTETIEACCETQEDHTIVRMRASGSTDEEIATYLGMPLTTVFMLRRDLYARFLKITGWKP